MISVEAKRGSESSGKPHLQEFIIIEKFHRANLSIYLQTDLLHGKVMVEPYQLMINSRK